MLHNFLRTAAIVHLGLLAQMEKCCVYAFPEFLDLFPNARNIDGIDAAGHDDPSGGGKLNSFGLDFDAAGQRWTQALCRKDSDGDGLTNGQELGDPCCKWSVAEDNNEVLIEQGISNPGSLDSVATNPEILEATCDFPLKSQETNESTEAQEIDVDFNRNQLNQTAQPIVVITNKAFPQGGATDAICWWISFTLAAFHFISSITERMRL